MQPLESYEVINFFEWVKESYKDSGKIGEIREIIWIAKHNSEIIKKIEPIVAEYVERHNKTYEPFELSESILVYLYHFGDCEEKTKVEESLWSDDELPKKSSIILNLMIDEKNKEKLNRYNNSNIYKCIIFPFKNDDTLKKLVKKHYDTLNKESSDYLDIFYSKKELKKSGFEIRNQIENLNIPIDYLPCIAIWQEKIENAILIPISGINEDGLLQLLLYIIQIIKTNPKAQKRYYKKCFIGKVEQIKSNNEFRKSKKEPIYAKLLWNILFPIGCSIFSSTLAGWLVYLITKS